MNLLITGGTGSLGWALVERFSPAHRIRIFSRDEKKQLDLRRLYPQFDYVLGDVRDPAACRAAVRDMDLVIHGASLKYVDVSERQPAEYVSTNITGTLNVINAVLEERTVKHAVGISSDKACAPVNCYGMTKALLEKLFLEAHASRGEKIATRFTVARYGNVVGTRGSVVLLWQELRRQRKMLSVTDPDMTRFFFTIDEAVDLIERCFEAESGVVVSKRMSSCTVGALAEAMQVRGWTVTGRRPGEKTHEMLLTGEEMARTVADGDYFIYHPLRSVVPHPDPEGYGSDVAPRLGGGELMELLAPYLGAAPADPGWTADLGGGTKFHGMEL